MCSINYYHSSKCRSTLPTTHTTIHLQHHIPFQQTHKTHTATTHLTTSTLAPKSSHLHQRYKHTLTHNANNNNQSTKTIHTNTTQPPQHTSHKIHHKRNQSNTLRPQHSTNSTPNILTIHDSKTHLVLDSLKEFAQGRK